jgi:hypothetical protein
MILTCEDEKNQVSIFDVEKRKYNQNNCYNIIIINFAYSIGGIQFYDRGPYDRVEHVVISDLDLVQFYFNVHVA